MKAQRHTPPTSLSSSFPAVLFTTLFAALFVSGCDFVGDVLEFGFWTGVILVGIIVLIIWAVARAFRR